MGNYYFHGVRGGVKLLKDIFDSGGLLSLRKRYGVICEDWVNGYNGLDYISICKRKPDKCFDRTRELSGFHQFAFDSICIAISNDVDVIEPVLISSDRMDKGKIIEEANSVSTKRYSDILDEYQVKDEIGISKFIAIGFPYKRRIEEILALPSSAKALYKKKYDYLCLEVGMIEKVASKYNKDIFLFDSSTERFMANPDDVIEKRVSFR